MGNDHRRPRPTVACSHFLAPVSPADAPCGDPDLPPAFRPTARNCATTRTYATRPRRCVSSATLDRRISTHPNPLSPPVTPSFDDPSGIPPNSLRGRTRIINLSRGKQGSVTVFWSRKTNPSWAGGGGEGEWREEEGKLMWRMDRDMDEG